MNFLNNFYEQVLATTALEFFAVIFGLLSVWYAKKENIWVYPTGIISVLIYVYICFNYKLYADMGINAYYFVMSVYGWIMWTRKDANKTEIKIKWASQKERIVSLILLLIFYVILAYVLSEHTDSDVPYWDSLTTSFFLVAMYLMATKKIENWLAWIVADLISIPLYAYKTLLFTSFQFIVFTLIAFQGYIEWKRKCSAYETSN